MSFFQLFQYCLGSGLGTIGDFSSKQLLLDPKNGSKGSRSLLQKMFDNFMDDSLIFFPINLNKGSGV